MQSFPPLAVVALALLTFVVSAAEIPLASVQRTLKDLGFYYGDASGQVDEGTRSALRRFQIRTGLPPTGEVDEQTVQALAGATVPKPSEGAPPSPPPSLRERARQTDITDREFLQHLQASNPETPPAVTSPAQFAPRARSETAPEPAPGTVAPAESTPSQGRATGDWTAAKAAEFVRDYLKAAEAPEPDGEIAFYAERVDYFDSGRVNRKFVANDQRSYYRRWPDREFTLAGAPELVSTKGARATIRFRIRYSVGNSRDRASGTTDNVVQVIEENDGPKIVGIHERKVRE